MDVSIKRKQPVDILTYNNQEDWFYLFTEQARVEGIDYILRKTVWDYAYYDQFNSFGTRTTPSSSSSPDIRSPDVVDLLESLNIVEKLPLTRYWDLPRLEKQAKGKAKLQYTITICIDDIDSKSLREFNTIKAGQEALQAKYSKIRPATAREDQIKLTNY